MTANPIVKSVSATAYDAKSGALLWQGRLGEVAVNGFSASPVGADGKVFFTNEEGETFVLKAGKTFELLHVTKVNEPVLASPAKHVRQKEFHLLRTCASRHRSAAGGILL